jgi:hypothetical protein
MEGATHVEDEVSCHKRNSELNDGQKSDNGRDDPIPTEFVYSMCEKPLYECSIYLLRDQCLAIELRLREV